MPNKQYRLSNEEQLLIASKRMEINLDPIPEWLQEMSDGKDELVPNIAIEGKTAVLCDIHLGYHDIAAIKCAIQYLLKENVENIVLNGDTLDAHKLSRWQQRKDDIALEVEIKMAKQFLTNLQLSFPKAKIFFKIGNHEDRLEKFILSNAAMFEGLVTWEGLLGLEKRGINLIESMQLINCNGIWIAHGHELQISSGKNPAAKLLEKTFSNVCMGHLHRTSTAIHTSLERGTKRADVIGCLSKLQRKYNPYSQSNHGFALIHKDGQIQNLKIKEGMIQL